MLCFLWCVICFVFLNIFVHPDGRDHGRHQALQSLVLCACPLVLLRGSQEKSLFGLAQDTRKLLQNIGRFGLQGLGVGTLFSHLQGLDTLSSNNCTGTGGTQHACGDLCTGIQGISVPILLWLLAGLHRVAEVLPLAVLGARGGRDESPPKYNILYYDITYYSIYLYILSIIYHTIYCMIYHTISIIYHII